MATTFFKKSFLIIALCGALAACESEEERAAEHYENGLRLLAEGDLQRALVEFRNTLNIVNGDLDAWRKTAETQLELGRRQAAYRSYLQIVEREPNDLSGRIFLSNLSFEGRNWDEFVRHGTVAVELDSETIEVQAIDLGLKYREAVLAEDGPLADTLLTQIETLAETLPENGILRQIRISAYAGSERFREAVDLLDKSIEVAPQDPLLYRSKLELLARLNDVPALEAELKRMIDVFDQETAPKTTYLQFLVTQGRPDDAEAFLEQLWADAPTEERNEHMVSLIQFILQTRGAEAGLERLNTALEQEPKNGLLRSFRAVLIFENGDEKRALTEMEALFNDDQVTLEGNDLENAQVGLARMLLANGNEVGARRQIDTILENNPSAADALKIKASWRIQEDRTDEAISDLRIAMEQKPEDPAIMLLMAQAYQRAGEQELMLEFLSRASETSNSDPRYAMAYARALSNEGKFRQAEPTLLNALRRAPQNVDVLQMIGQIYLSTDDIARAQQVLASLNEIDTPESRGLANNLNAAIIARQSGNAQALSFLEELTQEGEGDVGLSAKLSLIRAQLQLGEVDSAIAYAREQLAELPQNTELRSALALSLFVARDFSAAEKELREILDIDPTASRVWVQLARSQSAQGNRDAAKQTIDAGLEQLPVSPDLLWGKASYLEAEGDIAGAIEIYETLYAEASNSPLVANNLASLLTTYFDDEDSLQRAEIIAKRLKGTEVPAFQDTYGWILFRTGKAEESLPYLESAAEALQQDPRVQFHLGLNYAELGRTDEAIVQLQKAQTALGDNGAADFAAEIQTRLTEFQGRIEQ